MLVDNSLIFLRIAAQFLRGHAGVRVIGSVSHAADAVGRAQSLRPDVVLVDLMMPGISGLKLIPQLRTALPRVIIIAVSMMDHAGYRDAALQAGADAFVSKVDMDIELMPSIARLTQAGRSRSINEEEDIGGVFIFLAG